MIGHVCPPFVCFVKDSFIIKKKRKMYKRRKYHTVFLSQICYTTAIMHK